MTTKQKITPFLWFDNQAEDAMNHYVSIFPNSRIVNVSRYGEAGPGPAGTVMVGTFEIEGQQFLALNGGPHFKFTEAISLVVNCESQAELDRYWNALLEGGTTEQCGWLKDRYGLSWQIVPTALGEMMTSKDPAKAKRACDAMLKMVKLDIAALQAAYDGK